MARRPCRICSARLGRSLTHRGPCPVLSKAGRKGAKVQRSTMTTEERTAHSAKMRAAQRRTAANVCGFCAGPLAACVDGCKAAQATRMKGGNLARLTAAGQAARAAAAAAAQARLAEIKKVRPTHPPQALGNIHLTCIRCHYTGPAIGFKVAFSDTFGEGVCCVEDSEA